MRAGRLVGVAAISMLAVASPAFAAGSTEQLQRNLVQVKEGRFVYDDLSICHFNLPSGPSKKFQIRSRATAPMEGVISRDRFVAMIAATEYAMALGLSEKAIGVQTVERAAHTLDCDPLGEPIGTVDFELTMTMTREGMQIEATNTATKETNRTTRTWEEMFE